MVNLEELKNVDIYLLDQLMKGNIHAGQRILDAGCGKGRNLVFLFNQQLDVFGFDPSAEALAHIHQQREGLNDRNEVSTIEDYQPKVLFDVVICNAVLHFASGHDHFKLLFAKLVSFLSPTGLLFIRMTSDIGLEGQTNEQNGTFDLPDGSRRYLLTKEILEEQMNLHGLDFVEPLKTVNVNDVRCMSTLVLRKRL